MSPLLGALGDSSEYAYRGTLDDLPDDFILTDVTNVQPGTAVTTGPITITGINNRVLASVSVGASLAVNSGIFTSGPSLVRSGDNISVYVPTVLNSDSDFSRTYSTAVSVGKRTKEWIVTTRTLDTTPDDFTFTNFSNQELDVTRTSNVVTISGLDSAWYTTASITSGIGSFSKNGGPTGTSSTIANGDTISVTLSGPSNYSSVNTTEITVGTYPKTFSVSTRPADTTVDQFSFTPYTNVGISSSFDSNLITLTGADVNTEIAPVPLTATISGGFLRVQRGVDGGGNPIYIRDFSATPSTQTVYNGDILTLRVNSSTEYSTSTSAVLSITGANTPVGVTSSFTVTTRPPISDTIPKQFSIVDVTGRGRNISTISDPIVLTEMTDNPTGVATAYLTNNIDGAQFRVRRNGVVVRDFSPSSTNVLNNDVIDLRITTSPASNGTVSTRFNVDGVDNTDINNIVSQTILDSWVVTSAVRNCTLVAPSLTNVSGVEPSSLQSVTFVPVSYDSDCGVAVSTSNPNSYLDVNGVIGNNLQVLPGVACTVYMTAGTFSAVRSTTVTLRSSVSSGSTSSNWSVITRAITTPSVTLTANPSSISCGEFTTLSWTSTNAISITTDGFTGVTTSGSIDIGPIRKNTVFSATVTSSDGTTATTSRTVNVQSTSTATISADSTFIPFKGSVTLTWDSTNSSSVVSNFGVTAASGSITLSGLRNTTTYRVSAVSDGGCENSPEATVTVNVESCSKTTDSSSPTFGVLLNYTLADAGRGYDYYFTGLTGSSINSASRQSINNSGSQTYDGNSVGSGFVDADFYFPSGVSSIYVICRGAGGGGGGGGGMLPGGGGGGGGQAFGTIYAYPGAYYKVRYGAGGTGGPAMGAGNTPNNGGTGSFAGDGQGAIVFDSGGTDILRGRGGFGGGRNIGGAGGGGVPSPWQTYRGDNVNRTGNGGTNQGSPGSVTAGGSNYRAGGTGGGLGQTGGYGSGGYVYISWNVSIEGATWNTLVNGINNQYKSSFNRPASSSEMDFWIGQYVGYGYNSVSEVQSAIAGSGAFRSNSGAFDECGDPI